MPEESVQARELDFADQLLAELDASEKWPLPREMYARTKAAEGRAVRRGERQWIKDMAGWDLDREYVVDPLARRIAMGWADFLFAEDVVITAAAPDQVDNDGDAEDDETGETDPTAGAGTTASDIAQDEIDHMVEVTRLPALLHRAERKVVSEGEAYWKLHVNRAVADVALITWCSRLDTIPLFYGDRLTAAAFITERRRAMEKYLPADKDEQEVVYRHAEIHTAGRVLNVLYRGVNDELGVRVPLDAITESAGYAVEWRHGLPMLAGRVVNDLDDDDTFGVSEYDGVMDELLALNEAMTIAVENMRLTGKDRIFTAGKFMQADGSFDASMEVFQLEDDGGTLGEGETKPPIVAVEKSYDAAPAWMHITNLVKTIVNRVGLVPIWIGEDAEGHGDTGLAIRLRFIPTTNAAKGKTREWAATLPLIIDLMLKVASLPIEDGGFGRDVAQDEPPAVEFSDPIPTDTSRDLIDVAAATTSEVMSRYTGVKTIHPEWTDDQVEEELARIDKDKKAGLLNEMPPELKDVKPPGSVR